ncbi:unnamed protein product [Prorocentrum cordatum]|uniref:Peptidase A1 domain-containing protein n=1 Tax=Prorocentrum cordatum TaxID=2364126 RepID=A0ABN9T9U2_9DINO|nr:unnamed protein product [Polarella glacialis]
MAALSFLPPHLRSHSERLSPELRTQLKSTGTCCHPHLLTRRERRRMVSGRLSFETCQGCPATLRLSAPSPDLTALGGPYVKTTLQPKKFNGGRPIYLNMDSTLGLESQPIYLYFMQERLAWVIGLDYSTNFVMGFAGMEAQCPRDTKYWSFHNGSGFVRKHFDIKGEENGYNAPKDTDHIAWNVHARRWERETTVWENGRLESVNVTDDDDAWRDGESNVTAAREEEVAGAAENQDTDVLNITTDAVEMDDENATENEEDGDAAERETTGVGERAGENASGAEQGRGPRRGASLMQTSW